MFCYFLQFSIVQAKNLNKTVKLLLFFYLFRLDLKECTGNAKKLRVTPHNHRKYIYTYYATVRTYFDMKQKYFLLINYSINY